MDRKEFLDILRGQFAGNMQEGKAAAHVRYYEDYIQSQVRGGRPEREVLEELVEVHRKIIENILRMEAAMEVKWIRLRSRRRNGRRY